MADEKITPHKVTKPIQLLAAWLVGLCILDGLFLATALKLSGWLQATLVLASILNVPAFLGAMFMLQTKFRPEMQEDAFYSEYINQKTQRVVEMAPTNLEVGRLYAIEAEIKEIGSQLRTAKVLNPADGQDSDIFIWDNVRVAINDHLRSYKEIRHDLAQEGIIVTEIFGKTNDTPKPDKEVVSFSRHMNFAAVRRIILLLARYHLDGVEIHDPEEEIDPSDVYIGAYGYQGNYALFTDEVKAKVEQGMPMADFIYYVRRNRVREV